MVLLKEKSTINSKIGDKINLTGEIEFKNMDFHYPSNEDVLIYEDFNLHIPPGSTISFVGESGCGRSTLIKLLMRNSDPTGG